MMLLSGVCTPMNVFTFCFSGDSSWGVFKSHWECAPYCHIYWADHPKWPRLRYKRRWLMSPWSIDSSLLAALESFLNICEFSFWLQATCILTSSPSAIVTASFKELLILKVSLVRRAFALLNSVLPYTKYTYVWWHCLLQRQMTSQLC